MGAPREINWFTMYVVPKPTLWQELNLAIKSQVDNIEFGGSVYNLFGRFNLVVVRATKFLV